MSDALQIDDHATGSGPVRILRMHRPRSRNAMNTDMLVALVDALSDADADPRLRGVLLTGAGGVFSAGADLREEGDLTRRMELFTAFYEALTTFRLPTAAAVEGPAVGGGAEAVTACDYRVLARSAVLRFPGVVHGLPVGVARLVGNVGLGTARDWVLSARDVDAEEALAAGLAQRVVDDDRAERAALDWLELAATRDLTTQQQVKSMFVNLSGLRDRVAWENDALRAAVETGGLAASLDDDLPTTVRPRRHRGG